MENGLSFRPNYLQMASFSENGETFNQHYCLTACLYAEYSNLIGWIMECGPSIHFHRDGLDPLYTVKI